MKKEYELILKAVLINKDSREIDEISEMLKEDIKWISVAGVLLNHRLGGYFYMGLTKKQRESIPKEFRRGLELLVRAQKEEQEKNIDELLEINSMLVKEEIHFATLKGAFFGCEMYESGMRRSNDIDLLVFEKDLDKLDTCLRKDGYIQTNLPNGEFKEASKKEKMIQRMNYHDLVPYVKRTENGLTELDINFLFDGRENVVDEIVYEMGTKSYAGKYYSIVGLDYYTNLAFLCVHFYREASNTIWTEEKRDVTLYKIVDIMNYIRYYKSYIKKDKLFAIFEKLNIAKKAKFTFKIMKEFYDDAFLEEMIEGLRDYLLDEEYMQRIYDHKNKTTIYRKTSFFEKAFEI